VILSVVATLRAASSVFYPPFITRFSSQTQLGHKWRAKNEEEDRRCAPIRLAALALLVVGRQLAIGQEKILDLPPHGVNHPLVVTQVANESDVSIQSGDRDPLLHWMGVGKSRILWVEPDGATRVLTSQFQTACDPDLSFDATRLLFAAKKATSDSWNIYEMTLADTSVRQITRDLGDCRYPIYQPPFYTIVTNESSRQITFVRAEPGIRNEDGSAPATSLYSCKLDGTSVRRLTYNLSSDADPYLMPDGRILYSCWQRRTLTADLRGRASLFAVNLDGTDNALFAEPGGHRIQRMPCVTTGGLAVFVESDQARRDAAGRLACVTMRRPLHSYRPLTTERDGLFRSPSALPDRTILVSHRPAEKSDTYAVVRLHPNSGKLETVFDDPNRHDIQARLVLPRAIPDGRSSAVADDGSPGWLYCLDISITDFKQREWMPRGSVRRVRVLEGTPVSATSGAAPSGSGPTDGEIPPLAQRRILGEVDIQPDGSFSLEVPSGTPIELQLLDESDLAIRSCGWIWVMSREPRGCIGCHEDGELTPENSFATSFQRPDRQVTQLTEPSRTVDFRHDVMPMIERRCVGCHSSQGAPPRLDTGQKPSNHENRNTPFSPAYRNLMATRGPTTSNSFFGKYVEPGRARTSPLIWHLFGRNTSRPWDQKARSRPVKRIPSDSQPHLLTEQERRRFVEWIDTGAMWNARSDATPPRNR